jgi:hypothetical protein
MKKMFLFAVVLSLTTAVNAQQSIRFRYGYLPGHTYKVSAKNDMDMEMDMSGDSATTAQLQASGMKTPMLMKINMDMAYIMKTEAAAADKSFPFSLNYTAFDVKATLNGTQTPIPNNGFVGQVITGQCDAEGKMKFEKITGGTASDLTTNGIKEMVNKMMAQIKFPDKPMTIGETFTQEVPMNIPAAGVNLEFGVKMVYKLVDIKGNLAYFDTASSIDMNMNTEKDGVTIKGKGNGGGPGKMVYNISQSFPQMVDTDMTMNFDMTVKNMKMGMKIKGKSSMNNDIVAN